MWGLNSFLVFLTILQGVYLQGPPPPLCGPPPHENPVECCKIPQLFSEEDRTECGVEAEGSRTGRPDCSKIVCLFKKNELMKDDTNVDKEAIIAFVDKWVGTNSDYKDAIEKAKEVCLKDIPAERKFCEPGRIMSCMFFVTFDNCPLWEKNDKCDKLKDYMQQCKENFMKAKK